MLFIPRNTDGYHIHQARTLAEERSVDRLVRRMYAWRGYTMQPFLYRPSNPNRITIAIWRSGEAVATLTIGRDSSNGLLADALYAQELVALRQPGRIVCEVTRLAVHPDFRSEGMMNDLFRAAFMLGRERFGGSDAVIEVNPRHVRFYQRRFGFRMIGKERQCPRVNAPAVLLHQTLEGLIVHGLDGGTCGRENWAADRQLAEAAV